MLLTAHTQELYRSGAFLCLDVGTNIWGPNGSQTSIPIELTRYNQINGFSGEFAYTFSRFTFPQNPNNNEWYRWNLIFRGLDVLADVYQYINNYKIIIIKTSFNSSQMVEWGNPNDTLNPLKKSVYNYKWHWRSIIRIMRDNPNNFFVIWTNAPLVASQTNDVEAQLSHLFSKWAKDTLARGLDPILGIFPKNVYVFDYFHKVVGNDYKLLPDLALNQNDSRPNSAATTLIAPVFVQEICDAARIYEQENMPLLSPVMIYPINDEKNVPNDVVLRWHKVPAAKEYYVQVSRGTDFNYLEVDKTTKDTSLRVNLQYNTKYYWRVRAIKDGSNASPWPLMQMFTTIIEKPEIPELIFPEDNSEQIPIKPVFRWSKSKRAEDYRIQVATDKQFNFRIINTNFIKDTFYIPSEILQKNMTYYWRVMARNIGGETNWSNYATFKTEIPIPESVKLIYPENNADSMPYSITFKWSKSPFAQFYHLQIDDNSEFIKPIIDIDNLQDTTYKSLAIFDFDKTYYWKVSARNISGQGSWSDVWSFQTQMPELTAPRLIYPINDMESFPTDGHFIWNSQNPRFSYHLQIAEDSYFNQIIINADGLNDTIYKLQNSLDELRWYYCRIKATYKNLSSDWSEIIKFKTDKIGSVEDFISHFIEFKISPNPATDYIEVLFQSNIVFENAIIVRIYNFLGQCLMNYDLQCMTSEKSTKLDLRQLPPGTYLLQINAKVIPFIKF